MGTGDGSFVYRAARARPERLFISVDANGAALADRSRRAASKPARAGAANALFVRANVAALPDELAELADALTVLFPWGSLLRAVAAPDVEVLKGLRRVCRTGAALEVVLALPVARELASFARTGVPAIATELLGNELVAEYRTAGFEVRVERCSTRDLERVATTWSKRLGLDGERRFFAIRGGAV